MKIGNFDLLIPHTMKNLALFYGGFSSEFDISRQSAENILPNLPATFNSFLVEVTREGWFVIGAKEKAKVDWNDLSFIIGGEKKTINVGLVFIHGEPVKTGKSSLF